MTVKSMRAPIGRRPTREEGLFSVITNGNILYLVTFKWLLTGAYGLPHTFNALTRHISYFNYLVYNDFFIFFHLKMLRGAAPQRPVLTHRHWSLPSTVHRNRPGFQQMHSLGGVLSQLQES